MTRKSDREDKEIERRVDMKLFAEQLQDIHDEIFDKEHGLCKRVRKNEDDISQIKTVWATVYGAGILIIGYITRKL